MKKRQDNPSARRIIKKYSNRRLYDTRQSAYVTLENLHELILQGEDFQVVNAGDGADITAQSLAQVLVSEEIWGEPLFSERSLRNLIMFCGGPMRGPFLAFMEQCMPFFENTQRQFSSQLGGDAQTRARAMEHLAVMQGRIVRQVMENFASQTLGAYLKMQKEIESGARRAWDFANYADFFSPPRK